MPAFTAGMARFVRRHRPRGLMWWLHAERAQWWRTLAARTPDAPNFSDYPEEIEPVPFIHTSHNNCVTYVNACFMHQRIRGCRIPGDFEYPVARKVLRDALAVDGWVPGRKPAAGAHIAVAFCGEVVGERDCHFYRLGPDGWSHRSGNAASELVENPFTDAFHRGYRTFAGWWLVPHAEEQNRVRHLRREIELPQLAAAGQPGPLD